MCEELVITIGLDGETLAARQADEMQKEETYIGDANGGLWDPDLVREARLAELAGYREVQVYRRIQAAECGSHKVIGTRKVDTQRRRAISRRLLLVGFLGGEKAQQQETASFIAGTPPFEAVNFLTSDAMTKRVSRNNRQLKLSFIVEKAHLCSEVLRVLHTST